MSQTSLDMDPKAEKAIDELKTFFGVSTKSAAIKRALALARIAVNNADEDKQITLLDKKTRKEKIVVLAD